MKFCVIGAGAGGRAFAAYLSSKGYNVNLYNRSFSRISDIQKNGGIKATGELKGFFPIELATQNLRAALEEADIILIVTPAFAHKPLAKVMAPFLTEGQIIILNPGRTLGSVEFCRAVQQIRKNFSFFIGETQTLLFTARELSGNGVNVIKIKDSVNFSCFPDTHSEFIYDRLSNVFPQLHPIDDYLQVTLNNVGMLLHPAISIFNAANMERGNEFKFYMEGATKRVCQILEFIQDEINEIMSYLGLGQFKYEKWAKNCYGINATTIYDAIQKVDAYKNIIAPKELITRYFMEDVPTGLVPLASLGNFLGISTPTINSIIHLSSILCGKDFLKVGRTIECLEIKDYLKERIYGIEIEEKEISIDEQD